MTKALRTITAYMLGAPINFFSAVIAYAIFGAFVIGLAISIGEISFGIIAVGVYLMAGVAGWDGVRSAYPEESGPSPSPSSSDEA